MQQEHVALLKMRQNVIDVIGGDLLIGTTIEEDTVLAFLVHLDNSMTCMTLGHGNQRGVYAVFAKDVDEHLPISPHLAGMVDRSSCLG